MRGIIESEAQMTRRDWRVNPREPSLEPPDDDEIEAEELEGRERARARREDEETERFMEGR